MGAFFDATSAIVDLEPKAKPLSYAPGNRWLLWPVLAYRVYAPRPAPERLNLFQRSVLALCRAGVFRPDEIGYMLAIGPDLAACVLTELKGMALLDRRGELSGRAHRLLDDEPDDEIEPVAGYVFSDPFGGALWPRFHCGPLPYAEGEIQGNLGAFMGGSVGNPHHIFARAVWPPRGKRLAMPSTKDIMRACMASIRDEQAYARTQGNDTDHEVGSFGVGVLRRHLNQVVLVDDTPESIFLTTFVFVPRDPSRATRWQVCDPFGLGPSHSLRKRIEELESDKDGGPIRKLIDEVVSEGFGVEGSDLREHTRIREKEAAEFAAERAGFDLTVCPEVWEQLVQMESGRIEASETKDASGMAWDKQQNGLRRLVRHAHTAIEECLAHAVRTFPASDIWLPLSGSLEDNAILLAKIAGEIGFADDTELPCFEELLFVGAGSVKGVVLHDNRELVALLAASLLSASGRPEHPLRRAAEEFPGLIVFLHRLKRLRDQSSHHIEEVVDPEAAFGVPSETYRITHLMLPTSESLAKGPRSGKHSPSSSIGSNEWGADLVYRLRAQAARRVESEALFGIRVRELPPLRDALVDMEQIALELNILHAAGATAEEVRGRARDLVIACASAVEASVKSLLTETDVRGLISDDRIVNANRFTEAALSLGFVTAEHGQYHDDLLMVRPDRAHSTAATRVGALNALLMVATLQAQQEPDHPLREVATQNPRFLVLAGKVSQARGHDGNVSGSDTRDPQEPRDCVVDIVRTVLKVVT